MRFRMPIKSCCFLTFLALLLAFVSQKTVARNDLLASDSTVLVSDTILPQDTLSAKKDSTNNNAIDAPIDYLAQDSMVMIMEGGNFVYLYGDASVKYKDLNLTGEYIEIAADSSIVFATFGLDSVGSEFGYPVFKQGAQEYEMKKARYNFKTKKMYITDVITQQGDGYVTAGQTKKVNDDLFAKGGIYTTCDNHEHPHFGLRMTKSKIQPGKSVVTGPVYLELEGVPLPVALPFGYFPFSKEYSSGIIMPTYGDEMTRGFSLRDGGYYFAFNDYVDLALTGEVYTKGSWGVSARSTYRKRYKFSGNVDAGYLVTITGDKGTDDYYQSKDFRLNWSHAQDPKANPFSTFSASVNFSTSSYDRNSVSSIYSNRMYDNTKSSSVNYNYRLPNKPLSISANATINQQAKDTMVNLTLPNMTITLSDIYPFRRKEQVGDARWYESIRMSYTGLIMNSISTKEYNLMSSNLIKDWRNGMKHDIPISTSFNLLRYISISPSLNYTSRWYTNKIYQTYDQELGQLTPVDTTYGFNRVYDYGFSISANTKLYGMYKPLSILGKWTKGVQIRHVLTPTVSFSGAPDFSDSRFGYYVPYTYIDKNTGEKVQSKYSPYQYGLWGVPGEGKTGSMNFSLDNNLEMKVPVSADSTRKISIIDNLRLSMYYNFLADSMNWSNLSTSIRLKFGKAFTLNLNGEFDVYTYSEQGTRINVPRWKAGKGIGRLMNTGTSFSYSINNETLKKLFSKGDKKDTQESSGETTPGEDPGGGEDQTAQAGDSGGARKSLRGSKQSDGDFDSDGYMIMNIPWNLAFNWSMSLGYDYSNFNTRTREYAYKISQNLGFSGSLTPSKNWNLNFSTSYDFDANKFAYMQCSITRNLHCWQMSASVIPIGPYQSYSFTVAVSSSLLQDLKYTQSSNYRDAVNWGD